MGLLLLDIVLDVAVPLSCGAREEEDAEAEVEVERDEKTEVRRGSFGYGRGFVRAASINARMRRLRAM